MQLKVKDGNLSLRSLYKLIVAGWIIAFGLLFGVFFLLLIAAGLLTGEMMVNGEVVYGRGAIFLNIVPMLIIFPIFIVMHAFMFGGLIIGGIALYRKKRPLTLVDEDGNYFGVFD